MCILDIYLIFKQNSWVFLGIPGHPYWLRPCLTGPGWVRDRFVRQRLGQEVVGSTVPRTPDHWGEGSAREGDLGIGIVGCLKGSRTCYENRHQ